MSRLRIALVLESLNRPLRSGLQLAGGLGVSGVQVDAVGDLAPAALSQTGRKDFRHRLRSLNLELAGLGCPLRHGFDVQEGLDARLAHVRQVLSLAYDLGPRIVVAFAGSIPEDEKSPARQLLQETMADLGRHGERVGSTLALETGGEPPAAVRSFLSGIATGGLGVSLDPATLLVSGHDPVDGVRELHASIVHSYARDARAGRGGREGQEVPLGHGDIDWTSYLGALEEAGYRGWLTVWRGPCADPAADIKGGVAFLRRLVG